MMKILNVWYTLHRGKKSWLDSELDSPEVSRYWMIGLCHRMAGDDSRMAGGESRMTRDCCWPEGSIHEEAVYRDVYQEVNWKVTDAMFRTTSLRRIYKSMRIVNDYQYIWYHTKITDIVWSMWKHCTRARKSTSALKYMVSITTFWDADMIDMLCTIDNHRRLRNDKLQAEAPINAEWRAQAPINTESWAEALPSRKVDLRLFHFAFG
jgi:hypothetical protein